jgi:molecular chaperone HscB
MSSVSECWSCGQRIDGLFCPACKALQAPAAGFFTFFGYPDRLSLDGAELQKRFYELSRQLHPDRFTGRSAREREYSLEATAILNDAYRTLRDPVKRAEYLLTTRGLAVAEQRSKNVPPELLEEVFELNMALEEMRGGDENARPQLESARQRFSGMLADIDGEMEHQFRAFDQTDEDGRRPILQRLRAMLDRRRYIENLLREVEKELTLAA